MRSPRIIVTVALASLMAFVISACQKNSQTDMSAATDTTQVSQSSGTMPPDQTQPGAQGATLPDNNSKSTTTKSTKTTHTTHTTTRGSSGSSSQGSQGTYAEHRTIDTRTSNTGDRVEAKLAAPMVVGSTVVAEAGARVTGQVADLKRASKAKGKDDRASIALEFNSIETVDGPKTLHATVDNAEGKLEAKSTGTRDKLLIGGGAVVGGVIGKVAGGSTKSTLIGAVAGAAAGTGAVLMAKGHEISIPEGGKVSLHVDRPIMIVER